MIISSGANSFFMLQTFYDKKYNKQKGYGLYTSQFLPKSTLGVNMSITLVEFAAQYCFLLACHRAATVRNSVALISGQLAHPQV